MNVVRVPDPDNLNLALLRETVADLRDIGIEDRSALEFALSQTIIINSLGGKFWAKECTSFGERQAFFARKSDARLVHLANMLWCLKESQGFREFLLKNDRNSFEATYYECAAAHLFLKGSSSIQLVIPRKVRGADFDVVVDRFWTGGNLNVEVKARTVAFAAEKQVRNFLASHRSQLPANGNGVIFCKLEMSAEGIGQQELVRATQRFLRGTSRISFVVYCWDSAIQDNVIALEYFGVDSTGRKAAIFPAATQATVPKFMYDAGL